MAAAKLTTLKRTDGVTQVVYNGHPLYHCDDDHKPRQMEGQFVDQWAEARALFARYLAVALEP